MSPASAAHDTQCYILQCCAREGQTHKRARLANKDITNEMEAIQEATLWTRTCSTNKILSFVTIPQKK